MRRVIVLMTLLGVLVVGCDPASDPANVQTTMSDGVIDYGNGVYYFPYTSALFGNKLSAFIKEHEQLELVGLASNGTGGYGTNKGYFVYFRERGPCICQDMGPGIQTSTPDTSSGGSDRHPGVGTGQTGVYY